VPWSALHSCWTENSQYLLFGLDVDQVEPHNLCVSCQCTNSQHSGILNLLIAYLGGLIFTKNRQSQVSWARIIYDSRSGGV
jgi:hypothetical protein